MTFAELVDQYDRDHHHPYNRALHVLGITLIATATGLLLAAQPGVALLLFAGGWAAQFIGHAIEGRRPSFTRDIRFMAAGAVWYVRLFRRGFSAPTT
jgi:uncharacterized membrane protein YGL010W